jgi:hypothetical protein
MRRLLLLSVAVLTVGGCTAKAPKAQQQAKAEPAYNTDLTMNELMGHVVDPAAWTYWHGSGVEVTAKGERDLSPTTEEGWEQLENGAATLIEAGNLLQMEGRTRAPVEHWDKYARDLTARGVAAKAAAEKHDKQGVFDEGGRVYEVCTACHEEFVIQPALKAQGGPETATLPPWPKDPPKAKPAARHG